MADGADMGLVGLAVMGENLALNMESRGLSVAVYNRTVSRVDAFTAGRAAGKRITGCHSMAEFAAALARPRKALIMVKAGAAVDGTVEQLLGVLEKGDIIIDGGNSNYLDTMRRCAEAESRGL
ncbi:MAG: NADP-dependent phosphogluconate dehydrogenase, partial [Treponema sp.]|nr:NADP-dependent phosphogluconate dehydrogenase [Treponema sp.]